MMNLSSCNAKEDKEKAEAFLHVHDVYEDVRSAPPKCHRKLDIIVENSSIFMLIIVNML